MTEVVFDLIAAMRPQDMQEYVKRESEREPTEGDPRDFTVLLGLLNRLVGSEHLQKHAAESIIKDFVARPHLYENDAARALLREARSIAYARLYAPPGEWIDFDKFARQELTSRVDAIRHLDGSEGYPRLVGSKQVKKGDYADVLLHIDAVPEFLRRYRELDRS